MMRLAPFLATVLWALQASASDTAADCSETEGLCGDVCIPSDRICCQIEGSFGTVHAACPLDWACTEDGQCRLPSPPEKGGIYTPVCPEGMTPCGTQCITAGEVCCNDGSSCPAGLLCAPPPLKCTAPETEKNTPTPEPEPTRETSLLRPGDLGRPTTAADMTLPAPPEETVTETATETVTQTEGDVPSETEGECSDTWMKERRDANEMLEAGSTPAESETATSEETSTEVVDIVESTTVVTVTPTSSEAPEASETGEEDGDSKVEVSLWSWAAPLVAAVFFI